MSFIRIWLHIIWSTKNREKIISKELKRGLINHILLNTKEKEILIDTINCVTDHIHILLSLSPRETLSKTIQLIKGESSYWINKNNLTKTKFEWQDDYFAVSVSESQISKVREYIINQEEHNKRKSFLDEYESFIKKFGGEYMS